MHSIEFCAGREGDDAYARIALDGSTGVSELRNMREVAGCGLFALGDEGDK
jgi:hypothetical protein